MWETAHAHAHRHTHAKRYTHSYKGRYKGGGCLSRAGYRVDLLRGKGFLNGIIPLPITYQLSDQ